MGQRPLRLLVSFAGVAIVTFVAYRLIPVNTTTVGFAYLLLVLVIASAWGFLEAALASILATLLFNFFFFPPVGKFTIADPQNWVALFSFLATSLIASRLSTMAKRRALEAMERQRDLEHLYAFSRAMLLIDRAAPFPQQLLDKLAEIFELRAAVLFERNASVFYRTGTPDIGFEDLDGQLRGSTLHGMSPSDPKRQAMIVAVRLGPELIASLALQGGTMPESVLQGIANLVAIGLDRAQPDIAMGLGERLGQRLHDLDVIAVGRPDRDPQGHRPHCEIIASGKGADDGEQSRQRDQHGPARRKTRRRRLDGVKTPGHRPAE